MRYSSTHKEETKKRILDAASRGFRKQGYGGLGVDGIAKEAGVTSGAFYGHFSSKEEAFKAAVIHGMAQYSVAVERFQTDYGKEWMRHFLDYYLSSTHRHNLEGGCAAAGLSAEVMRADCEVRLAYQNELLKVADALASGFSSGTDAQKKDCAFAMVALLAGGVILSRSVKDEELAADIAKAVRHAAELIASEISIPSPKEEDEERRPME
jgi:AcrR family transcriptional regulator